MDRGLGAFMVNPVLMFTKVHLNRPCTARLGVQLGEGRGARQAAKSSKAP